MNQDIVVAKNANVVARQLAESEGAVLLNLQSGAYHGLNPVGLLVWELIDAERTVRQLVEAVREAVTDPPTALEADVHGFLENALERDLIRTSP